MDNKKRSPYRVTSSSTGEKPEGSAHRNASSAEHVKQGTLSSKVSILSFQLPRHPLRILRKKLSTLSDTKVLRWTQHYWPSNRKHPSLTRLGWALMALLMLSTIFIDAFVWRQQDAAYALTPKAQALLPTSEPSLAQSLAFDTQSNAIEYNKGYTPSTSSAGDSVRAKFSASFSQDPKTGITVTDPYSQVSLTIKPRFDVKSPQQNQNRVVYPLTGRNVQQVFTAQSVKLKEDIILNSYQGDTQEFSYDLVLNDGLEAQIEPNGSIGVYGVDSNLLGNVTTGSDADAALLKKARDNAPKTNLIFSIPAPFVKETGKNSTDARAWYRLKDDVLTIYAVGLKDASYPLTIDPSVYIETAAKLMRGNNESNIDFDIDNELIQKGKTTGGRFDQWNSTLSLPSARWNQSTAVAGGYIYIVGGNDGSSTKGDLYWAHFNTSTGAIEATNPGDGACSGWCTNSAYNLPSSQVRQGASMVAYNGYLYLFGGLDSGGSTTSTVYITKLGANGEPQLWHPTDTNKNNWVYWYSDTAMSSNRAFLGAVAYNNRMYVVGGSTTGWTGGSTTVQKADINPVGTLSGWTTTGMSQLSTAIMSHSLQTYNDYLYVIGGISTSTTQSAVLYTKINTDGTINAWQTGNPIGNTGSTTPRAALGGKFATIWGGFIYVAGGCSTTNGSGYCTSIASDTQLASINADGSITDWTTVIGVTSSRMGYGLMAWRNSLYGIGGCTVQNTSTGACTTVATATNHGAINPDGDVSTVSTSVPNGTSPCVSAAYYNCDLPPQGDSNGQAGGMAGGTIINNGFIYYMGGCTAVGNNSVCFTGNSGKATDNIAYAQIDSVGHITRVSSCSGSFVGSWCAINGTGAMGEKLAAFGYSVFNNTLYIIGGTTGTQWQDLVWRTTFNSDGTWGSWSSQTFANVGLGNAKGYQYAFTRANPGSASTYPGNLYVLGGCSGVIAADDGLDCTGTLYTGVYKCYIKTDGSIETSGSTCTTSGQLQIDSEPGTSGTQGLGVAAGTVYANYIYLVGGQSPNEGERGEVLYAKIDNSNNIVSVDGGSIWVQSPYELNPVRRRGSAFGYNGYLYALAGFNIGAGGSLNDLLYAKINVSDGSISDFSTSSVTVTARWDLRSVVNNGYVYAIGGCSVGTPPASCTTMTSTVQTFQLYNNYSGSPKLFNNGSQYSTNRYGAGAAILDGYIYMAGGCTTAATDCTTATTSVESAPINAADGTIGTWTTSGVAALPAARTWGKLLAAGGTLYYVGGQASGSTNGVTNVYYATPSSGAIGSWTSGTSLPAGKTQFGGAVWHDRLYIVGGLNASSTATNTVYVSSDQESGGNISSWGTTSVNLNVARSGPTVVAYANNLYLFGGYTGSNYLNDAQFASIGYKTGTLSQSGTTVTGSGTTWTSGMVGLQLQYADGSTATITGFTSATSITVDVSRTIAAGAKYVIDDGSVGAWSYTTSLPVNLRQADGFAANGFLYLFGGRSTDTTCISSTIVAPISANTTIAAGNNPTGIGEWYATNIKYSGARYGANAVYDNGKAYVLGGQCNGTMITTTNRNQYSVLQSQPQIARYSRMIDTDSDVFPTKWLMNGLDNSTGARWYMRYRSSTAANASWGQDTNFGEIPLGVPETYTPIDGSGTGTSYARYYYMIVTIDSQQAYGYPEDVSRGPTIADLSLFYTADPSKRLIHGKTFTGGEQQPLDTPF